MTTPGEAPDPVNGFSALSTPELEAVLRVEERKLAALDRSSELRDRMQILSDAAALDKEQASEAQARAETSQRVSYEELATALRNRPFSLVEPGLRIAFYREEDRFVRFKTPEYPDPSQLRLIATALRPNGRDDEPAYSFMLTAVSAEGQCYFHELQSKEHLLGWVLSGALRFIDDDEVANPTP